MTLAGILWGPMGLFVRYFTAQGLDSLDIVFVRIFFSALFLAGIALVLQPKAYRIRWKDSWCFVGSGLVCIVFFTYFYFRTISLASLSVAAVLLYTSPVFVMFFSLLFFREKLTAQKIFACGSALVGCMFVSGLLGNQSQQILPIGLLTGILSGITYALYSIFGTFALRKGYSSLTTTLYTFLFAVPGAMVLCDLPKVFQVLTASWANFGMAILMALVTAAAPYIFYTLGLSKIDAGPASIIASIEPVVATVVGILVFSEPLTIYGAVGILLVLSAIVLLNLPLKKRGK